LAIAGNTILWRRADIRRPEIPMAGPPTSIDEFRNREVSTALWRRRSNATTSGRIHHGQDLKPFDG
jgi:hypothetical protein